MSEAIRPAVLSDWLFTSAVGVYMLAALLSACEYVLGRYPIRRTTASVVVVVGAGAGESAPTALDERPQLRRVILPQRLGRVGVALTVLGLLLHLTSVTLRGVATARIPWANMYEYLSAVGLVAVCAWLYVLRKHPVRRLAVFVLLPISLLLFWPATSSTPRSRHCSRRCGRTGS